MKKLIAKVGGMFTKTLPWGKLVKNVVELKKEKRYLEMALYLIFGGLFVYLIAKGVFSVAEAESIVELLEKLFSIF